MRPDHGPLDAANEPQQVQTAAGQTPDAAVDTSASPSIWPKVIPGKLGDPTLLGLNERWPQQGSKSSDPDAQTMKDFAAFHWRFLR